MLQTPPTAYNLQFANPISTFRSSTSLTPGTVYVSSTDGQLIISTLFNLISRSNISSNIYYNFCPTEYLSCMRDRILSCESSYLNLFRAQSTCYLIRAVSQCPGIYVIAEGERIIDITLVRVRGEDKTGFCEDGGAHSVICANILTQCTMGRKSSYVALRSYQFCYTVAVNDLRISLEISNPSIDYQ